MSEALIFVSTNPQYDDRITSSIHENSKLKPGENMLCTEIVSDIQINFCTQHVLPLFGKKKSFWQRFTCNDKTISVVCTSSIYTFLISAIYDLVQFTILHILYIFLGHVLISEWRTHTTLSKLGSACSNWKSINTSSLFRTIQLCFSVFSQ